MIAALLATLARLIAGGNPRFVEPQVEGRQRVYFANHSSHLDFILVWAALPPRVRQRTRPVAARDYWHGGPLRRYLAGKIFRAVLVDRAGPSASVRERGQEAVSRMVAGLGDTDSLILFPEGTRGSGEGIAPFKSGLYHLAHDRPGLELVPVRIENLNRVLPKGEFLPVPLISRITFGPALYLNDGESKDAFLERARDAVQRLSAR